MTYAIIGCGRISHNHILAALENNLEIVALCNNKIQKAEDLKLKYGLNAKVYKDYKDMLKAQKPDIVTIATPSGAHAIIALDLINAGCNVLIEKPISLSIKDADEIIKASESNNIKVGVCHQNRFNLTVQKLRAAIEQGRFGRIFHITANVRWYRDKDYYKQANWRGTLENDGGCLMNQCIHNIDLLCWTMGCNVEQVFSYRANFLHPYIEAEDTGIAVVKFVNGALGVIEGTVNTYPKNLEETLCVFGERGTVKLGGTSLNNIDQWIFDDGIDTLSEVQKETNENPPNIYGFGHVRLYADFINAIKKDNEPYITAKDGKKAVELILAMYKSSYINEPVNFPLVNCSTLDFIDQKLHSN